MIQNRSSFVQSEPPIAFELRFREELIQRGLLRELNLFASILFHVRRLVSGDARLNIKNPPRLTMRLRIVNSPNHAVGTAVALLRLNGTRVDVNFDSEIGSALAHRTAQRIEAVMRVFFAVDGDYVPTAPFHQFVQADVLEQPTIT